MQVVSLAPVPVASRMWRFAGQPWSLAVVCKITVRLEPGKAQLAKSHEPIHEREVTAGAAWVLAPADLVPARQGVDITLVGDAYPPATGRPFRTRLQIAGIDKEIRIEPSGRECRAPEAYGPFSSSSATRQALLSGGSEPASDALPLVLPGDFDMSYYNCAPLDQRVDELPSRAHLRLERLHPTQRALETRLPDVLPQFFVQRGRERNELTHQLDTLWIDSRRALATMTWRCQVPLSAQDEEGRIWVTVAGPGRRMSGAQLSELIRELGGSAEDVTDPHSTDEDGMARTAAIPANRARGMRQAAQEIIDGDQSRITIPALPRLETSGQHTSAMDMLSLKESLGEAPSWLAQSTDSSEVTVPKRSTPAIPLPPPRPPAPPSRPRRRPVAKDSPWSQPGKAEPADRNPRLDDTASLPGGPQALAGLPPLKTAAPPKTSAAPRPEAAAAKRAQRKLMQAALAEASVGRVRTRPATQPPPSQAPAKEPTPAPPRTTRKRPPRPLDMLWFDRSATLALRKQWQSLCTELDFAPRDRLHDLATEDPELARDHHTHFGLLAQVKTTERATLRTLMQESVAEDGRFRAPLCALEGALRVCFAPLESLAALVAAMKPFGSKDSKLGEALEQAEALLEAKTSTVTTLSGASRRVREAFEQSSGTAAIERIDKAVERSLLEQRHYDRRTLLGGDHIRALLQSGKHEIVCYLNEELEKRLPMMPSFDVRMLAEAHPRQDQSEAGPHALRVLTLGRIIQL